VEVAVAEYEASEEPLGDADIEWDPLDVREPTGDRDSDNDPLDVRELIGEPETAAVPELILEEAAVGDTVTVAAAAAAQQKI